MAKKKAYRRKNRRLELTVDIPGDYTNDEDFLNDLADRMDELDWVMVMGTHDVDVNRIKLGDLEFDKEEE